MNAKTTSRLKGRWVTIARVVGVAIAVAYIGLFIVALPAFYQHMSSLSTSSRLEEWTTQALRSEFLQGWTTEELLSALTALRLSPALLAAYFIALDLLAIVSFGIVGALIFWHRSDEWIGLYSSLFLVIFGFATAYSITALVQSQPAWAPWIDSLTSVTWAGFLFFLIIFPDGRFVPRWTVFPAALVLPWILAMQLLPELAWSTGLGFAVSLAMFGAVVYGQVYRYRRASNASQRQQTKWMVFAVATVLAGMLFALALLPALLPALSQPSPSGLLYELFIEEPIQNLVLLFVPLAIGIAILRYRLWDIDVVINRALIYGALTAVLAGVWAGSVVLVKESTKEIFGSDSTVASTAVAAILVASLFQPLRDRIKTGINKRLYPEKVDLAKDFVEFAPMIPTLIGTDALLNTVVERSCNLMHTEYGGILLRNEKGMYEVSTVHEMTEESVAPFSPPKKMQAEFEKARAVRQEETDAFRVLVPLYIPRLHQSEVIGIMGLGPREKGRGYSSDDLTALAKLGGEVGTAIYLSGLSRDGKE